MKQNFFYTLFIGLIFLLSIKSSLQAYSLDDILDAASRVKQYVLKHKKIPKTD